MEKAQILIVENDGIIAMDLESRMKQLGYGVTGVAGYGEQAIEKVKENTPDVVLMDIILKGEIDGIEAAEEIRTQYDIPVIFITGYADKERLKRAKLAYPFGFIIKPFSDKDLEVTIEMALYVAKVDAGRRKAEKELYKTKEQLENLLSASPAAIYRCEPEGDFPATFISDNVRNQLGYEPQEFTDDSQFWANNIHPEDKHRVFAGLTNLFEKGYHSHDYRFLHKDGSYRWMYDNLRLIYGIDGNPVDVIGNWIDITDRKQTEEALRESEKNYRLLVNNIPGFVYKGYKDWSVDFYDEKIELLTGYDLDDFNSRRMKWIDIIVEEDIETARDNFIQALKTDKSYVREYRIKSKAGDIFWIQERGQIVCNNKEEIEYVSGVFFDITEHKQMEK